MKVLDGKMTEIGDLQVDILFEVETSFEGGSGRYSGTMEEISSRLVTWGKVDHL